MSSLLIVDAHTSYRQAVGHALARCDGVTIAGLAGSVAEARPLLHGVDLLLSELALPDGEAADLLHELLAVNPQAKALVVTASPDDARAARAVAAGAAGILHKCASIAAVIDAVTRTLAGESLLTTRESLELLRRAYVEGDDHRNGRAALAGLSVREREVLQLLGKGLSDRAIGELLGTNPKTVRGHVVRLMAKLGVHSRLQAVVFAVRHGAIQL